MTAIDNKYAALGGSGGFLGSPTTAELPTPDRIGRFRHYQRGSIYWSPATGAHEVHGAIRRKWSGMGWERSFLRYPATDETRAPDGRGRYNHFERGSIYWTSDTGAHEVHGAIRAKWASMGWERSFLRYPTTDETRTPDGRGRFNHFEHGSIYWTPTTGAHEVHGAIRGKWASLGWERGFLRYPMTDETRTPDGRGRYNHFEGGSIYWTRSTGAHEVHGAIRAKWASMGWERSWLGYPTSDEQPTPDNVGRISHFEHGSIYWSPATGAHALRRGVRLHFKLLAAPNISTDRMLDAMQQVFATSGIRVELGSVESLNLPALVDLDVGACVRGATTDEQDTLFANRNNANANDIVIYYVRSTLPPYNGCAAHPAGRPAAVVARGASLWTLGHEIGHVLGLNHVNNNDRLMTGNGTANITNPPPDLIGSESSTMNSSTFTFAL